MSQALTPANPSQQAFIHNLADQLGIRKLDSYLDSRFGYPAPEHMTGSQASHIIDVLKLRKLSQRVKRPVTVDLTDRNAVRDELARLEALNPYNKNGNNPRGGRMTVTRIPAQPKRTITVAQERRLRSSLDRSDQGAYATGRFAETVGRGSNASYSIQVADSHAMGAEPLLRQATQPMVDYIKSLAAQKNIEVLEIPTRFDLAQELLNQLIASPKMPTASMKRELADLRKATDSPNFDSTEYGTYDQAKAEITQLHATVRYQPEQGLNRAAA